MLDGRALADGSAWLLLLVVYDVIFLAVSIMTFDYVLEE